MPLPMLAVSVSLASLALADVAPTAPGPNETFLAGSNCTLEWDADTSGTWKNMSIGSNDNMSMVTNVVSGLDGTDSSLSPYNWTCPEVDPYSAIYFYQFKNGGNGSDLQWTTRFTIASWSNASVPPEHSQQPNDDPIPWGDGVLASHNATDTASGHVGSPASGNATSGVQNVNLASARTGGGESRDPTDGQINSSDQDEDGGDDDGDDDDGDDDDGDDDDGDDDDGDDDDGDGDDDDAADDGGDYDARDTGSSHHTSSQVDGDSNSGENSASDFGNDDPDNGSSGDSYDAEGSGSSGKPADDGNGGNYGTFTGTRTFHHMQPSRTPDSRDRDPSVTRSEDSGGGSQGITTSTFMPSSRMMKQQKATGSLTNTHSGQPRALVTGTLDPTLSMPSEAARAANTESQAHASASSSMPSAGTSATADGNELNDAKLASAGSHVLSASMGPAWVYLLLAAVGIVPQVVRLVGQ